MASEVYQYTPTIPAGTTKAALYRANFALDYREVESIDLEVPPGPMGLVGFALYRADTQVIPIEPGEWIVWDDHHQSWAFTGLPTGKGWALVGYNSGIYNHTVTVRFHVSKIAAKTAKVPVPVDVYSYAQIEYLDRVILA